MEIATNLRKSAILFLFKNISNVNTISSLAKELKATRPGIWKVLKKLEEQKLIILESAGIGKKSTKIVNISWNELLEKTILLYLIEESLKQKRWLDIFEDIKDNSEFVLLYGSILPSPKQANDLDLICVVKNKNNFLKIDRSLVGIQKTQSKKIHLINFTKEEFLKELKSKNKAFIDAIKKGVILYGQENYINFIKTVKLGG